MMNSFTSTSLMNRVAAQLSSEMAPLVSLWVLLAIFYAVNLQNTVSGECQFPATYRNRFWFRMYASSELQKYTYRQFMTTDVTDNRNDVTTLQQSYPCWNVSFDSTDSNTLYYLVNNYGTQTCAKSSITNDTSAILLQEAFVSSAYTDASQCRSVFTANCTSCDALWMPVVNQLTQPPPFGSSVCPIRGSFQLTASLAGSPSECSGDIQSTATFSDSTVQMNLCSQGTLRNMTFRTKTLLQDSLMCMASLGGSALNAEESGSTIVLLSDSNVLCCARLRNLSGGVELLINVKSSAYYAGCSFATDTTSVLQLFLRPIMFTAGLRTTTPPFATPPATTAVQTLPMTPVPSITTTLPTISTNTTITTTTSNAAITIPTTTIPRTTAQVQPGDSSSVTMAVTSKDPPVSAQGPTDNCFSMACASGAVCDEATHTCSCQAVFYTYSNSSNCVQDDSAIDDAFLKIIVPIIAIVAAASLIAALVLCFATRPLDAALAESTGATLTAASADDGIVVSSVPPDFQPAIQRPEKPVSYGRNDTFTNVDTFDRSPLTYGGRLSAAPSVSPNDFVMVGSSIPVKM